MQSYFDFLPCFVFLSWRAFSLSVPTISEERERALWGVYPTGDFMNSAPTQHMPGWSWIERGACGSPRRMRIVRRPLENSRAWICRALIRLNPFSVAADVSRLKLIPPE